MPKIAVYKGRSFLFHFVPEKPEVIIGRSEQADIPLDSPEVSRRHCRLKREGATTWVAEDLGTRNGMFVNGTFMPHAILKDGDRIEIMGFALVFEQPKSEIAIERAKASGRSDAAFMISPAEVSRVMKGETTSDQKLHSAKAGVAGKAKTAHMTPDEIAAYMESMKRRRSAHIGWLVGNERHEYVLGDTVATAGWIDGCAIRLPGSKWFARLGFRIEKTAEGQYSIVPLHWARPVKVEGARIRAATPLADGQSIEMGGLRFKYQAAVLA